MENNNDKKKHLKKNKKAINKEIWRRKFDKYLS